MISNAKVIYVGFHKTGTSSIGKLFRSMGMKHTSHYNWKEWQGDDSVEDALNFAEKYEAFDDVPWNLIYKQLDERFPNSKFIFYERNIDKWWASCLNFFGRKPNPMHEYMYGIGYPFNDENLCKNVYMQHSEDVNNYFQNRPNDFMQIHDLTDKSAQKIGKFLRYNDYQSLTMPHQNKSHKK